MKKLIPCMLAGLIITGLFALCITSFLAPSANYIQDALDPPEEPEEPFYFVLNPSNFTGTVEDVLFLSALTNVPDCTYSWEFINYTSSESFNWRLSSAGTSFDGGYYRTFSYSRPETILFYRCVASWHGRTIYSAPCIVHVYNTSKNVQDFKELEKNSEYVVPDVFEVLPESEVIE